MKTYVESFGPATYQLVVKVNYFSGSPEKNLGNLIWSDGCGFVGHGFLTLSERKVMRVQTRGLASRQQLCACFIMAISPPRAQRFSDVGPFSMLALMHNPGQHFGIRGFMDTPSIDPNISPHCGTRRWMDFNLFGHQIVAHLVDSYNGAASLNAVDGDPVPVPHFGLALSTAQFHALAGKVRKAGVQFEIEPHVRFEGQPGEQWTMFFKDPSGNCLEFKAMAKPENLFVKYCVE
jgi:uncharacterized protein